MPYNQQAESHKAGTERFLAVYSDIADATPTDRPFRANALLNDLPSIKHLAPKTQREIIAVVIRDMQTLPDEADGLTRVRGGVYQWRFGARH